MPHAALPSFTSVIVFGDSLVDPGNALQAAKVYDKIPFVSLPNGAPTASKGYFQGRFTDGWNFADLISNKFLGVVTKATFPYGFEDPVFGIDVPFVNRPSGESISFAYGGAQAIQGSEPVPDLDDQTDAYRNFPRADPTGLYIVTIGGNDVRELVPKTGSPVTGASAESRLAKIAAEIAEEVGQVIAFGARHVLVTGIPDIGLLPQYSGLADEAMRRSLATEYSQRLDVLVQEALARLQLPAGAQIYGFDLIDFSNAIFADPTAFALTNLTEARTVVQAGALMPFDGGFLFFDQVHPSAQVHAQAAARVLDSLSGGGPDAAAAALLPGPQLTGMVELTGGLDSFTVSLVAGQTYAIDLLGISSGEGSLADPKLRLLDPTGAVVAQDDDAGLGLDARLAFTAPASGAYVLEASAVGVVTGTYRLQVADASGGNLLQTGQLRGSNVTVQGGAGADTLVAESGANVLRGDDGADSITGGSGFDDINGNAGADTIRGGAGDDWVVGGKDNDRLFGDDGDDIVLGNLGDDVLQGGPGADVVRGGQGDDIVQGGAGDDWLAGDLGADTLAGGRGADVFHTHGQAGLDVVIDFNAAEGDRVNLPAGSVFRVEQVGPDVVITVGIEGQMILLGVNLAAMPPGWIFTS